MPFVKPVIDDGYPPGVDNSTCNISLFNSVTPLYVELHVSGIVACPGVMLPPPNGVYLLTQTASPNQWLFIVGGIQFQYDLSAGFSQVVIFAGALNWFGSLNPGACFTLFTNILTCTPGVNIGHNGSVEVFWGPTIKP